MKLPVKIIFNMMLVSFLLISSFSFVFASETYSPKTPLTISRTNQSGAYSVSINSAPSGTNKNVQGAFDLVFEVIPDSNGNWTYSVPEGLDPGTYTVTVKDQSGNVLETSTFTVTSTKVTQVLPNTGIFDEIILPVFGALTVVVIGGYLMIRPSFKKNILE